MNQDQLMSIARSVVLALLGAGVGALVSKGILTSDQASTLVPEIATAILGIGGVAVAYFGQKTHSASSVVATVNSATVPGVKVVAETSLSPAVAIDSTSGKVTLAPASATSTPTK